MPHVFIRTFTLRHFLTKNCCINIIMLISIVMDLVSFIFVIFIHMNFLFKIFIYIKI